ALHQSEWDALARSWKEGLTAVRTEAAAVNSESRRLFPSWSEDSWSGWVPPTTVPPAARFGELTVRMSDWPDGMPRDDQLRGAVLEEFNLPALAAFQQGCSVLLDAPPEARARAELALQALMFRLLTAAPPGKVRFTIIDPVGLGHNFSAFMHLAD